MTQLQITSLEQGVSAKVARSILASFEAMFAEFLNITLGAQARFEQAQWQGVQQAMRDRLKVYEAKVAVAKIAVSTIAFDCLDDSKMWHQAKRYYAQLVSEHDNDAISQTFFNSVFGSIRGHNKIRDVHLFILKRQYRPLNRSRDAIESTLPTSSNLTQTLTLLLQQFHFRLPYEDSVRDIHLLNDAVIEHFQHAYSSEVTPHWCMQYGNSLFFRNKAAYIIGTLQYLDGAPIPFAIALLNNEEGEIFIDSIMLGDAQLSMLFGFARTYFMVDTDKPQAYVEYLSRLLPNKERFELFNAIGFIKHAKTEFYRFKVDSTRKMPADEYYCNAAGIKGMVMTVFTTEHSDYVYKVIRDKFVAPKQITRQQVMEKYDFVKNADRVGRLVDTHEFRYLAFDLSRFSPSLLAQLQHDAGQSVVISGNALILKHVYVERKMTPLNLYIQQASSLELAQVMYEYGLAIKELAAANIFPGDMLMKNFGVTRWGRVVFYDYDEICPLTECHFRTLPVPNNQYQRLAEAPWFLIDDNDIFPEQFPVFFTGHPAAKKLFERYHADLYTPEFWINIQHSINQGAIADVFPYKQTARFSRKDTV